MKKVNRAGLCPSVKSIFSSPIFWTVVLFLVLGISSIWIGVTYATRVTKEFSSLLIEKFENSTPGDLTLTQLGGYLSLNSDIGSLVSYGYVLVWGGIIAVLISVGGAVLIFWSCIDQAWDWVCELGLYPIILMIFSFFPVKSLLTLGQFVSLFSALITGTATVKLWEQTCKYFLSKVDMRIVSAN